MTTPEDPATPGTHPDDARGDPAPDPTVSDDATRDEVLAARAERLEAQGREGRTISREEYRRTSRRAFLGGAVGIAAGVTGFRWVQNQESVSGIPRVLRAGHEFNDRVWRVLGSPQRSAPEFPLAAAQDLRTNGRRGLQEDIDVDAWSMRVEGPDGRLLDEVVLDDVQALDHVDMVTEHKCIEGWSQVAHWTGVRFADFAQRYASRIGDAAYTSLETPDGGYYVGLDQWSATHPQTLLAWALGGEPLTQRHGAPLRLVTPNHYGIKSLKRIGVVRFTRERPPDFWAERSYDWYSKL